MSAASSSLSLFWSDLEDSDSSGSHVETVSQLTATATSTLILTDSRRRHATAPKRVARDEAGPSGITVTPSSTDHPLTSTPLNGASYGSFGERERTYKCFKRDGKLPERERRLCDAGFYQVTNTNNIECHDCHVNISLAEIDRPDVNGWVLHVRSSPECRFVLREKGEAFVNSYRQPRDLTADSESQRVRDLQVQVESLQRQLSQNKDESQTRMDGLQNQLESSMEIQRGTEARTEGLRYEFDEHRADNLRRMNSIHSLVDSSMEFQHDVRSMCSENSSRIDCLRNHVCDEVRQLQDSQQEFQQDVSTTLNHLEEHMLPNNVAVMNVLQRQGSAEDEFLPTVLDGLEFDNDTDDEDM